MPMINIEDAYILNETGAQVDKTTGIPFKNESLTEAEAAQARANIRAGGSNPNLLDNAYFVGGGSQLGYGIFPINQRGQTSYSGSGRMIDRWIGQNNSGGMTLTADGIVFTNSTSGYGYIRHTLTRVAQRNGWTLSILTADGTVYQSSNSNGITLPSGLFIYWSSSNSLSIRIPGSLNASEKISYIKYEAAPYSTALNDGPPDFGEQLEKCKRYLQRVRQPQGYTSSVGFGMLNASSNILRTTIPLSSPLCNAASITATATNTGQMFVWGNGSYYDVTGVTGRTVLNGNAIVDITVNGTLENYKTYNLILNDADAYIDLSAEL